MVLEEFQGVTAGENTSAVINILDTDVTGGLVLPAVPVVGLLIHFGGLVLPAVPVVGLLIHCWWSCVTCCICGRSINSLFVILFYLLYMW